MKTSRLTLTCILFAFVAALPAMAGPRTFVSGLGNDASPGTREQPKRTFASALAVTDVGGEIVPLDSAGYASSPLTITKSVSIITPPGVYAGVRVTSADGIRIAAGPEDVVVLRGLTITGGGAYDGINVAAAGLVHVENCVVSRFVGGIVSRFPSSSSVRLFLKDTNLRANSQGVSLQALAGNVIKASIEHCRIEGHYGSFGVFIGERSEATLRDSVITGNFQDGVNSRGTANVENCEVSHNGNHGILVFGAMVRVSNTIVTDNAGFGFITVNGGIFESRGNNTVRGNAAGNTWGSITTIPGL